MMNSTIASTPNGDAFTNMLSTLCLWTAAVSIASVIHIWLHPVFLVQLTEEPESDWKIIGVIRDEALYERTYPSGKKAWRYKSGNTYVYPRRSDLASFGILK